jgi:hypothetical protein
MAMSRRHVLSAAGASIVAAAVDVGGLVSRADVAAPAVAGSADRADPGTVSIFTTVVDLAAPLHYGGDISNPSLARELSADDPQERPQITKPDATGTRRGLINDRNAQPLLAAPFPLPDPPGWGSAVGLRPRQGERGPQRHRGLRPGGRPEPGAGHHAARRDIRGHHRRAAATPRATSAHSPRESPAAVTGR